VKDYEAVLVQADEIPKGLQVATMYTLAQLSFVTENYPKAIEHMTTWIQEAENPGSIPYVFLGQVYLQMRDFPGALENVRKGIRTAEESGVQVQDTWTKLEAYLQSAIDQGGRIADFPLSGQGVDGEYLPIVKVAPIYPPRAQREKTEGYVELEFAVSRTGRVVDPVVVESHPPGVFDRAALDAVTRFKYKPRVSAGEPVEVAGVRNRITFELD
jgi:TonB family protein